MNGLRRAPAEHLADSTNCCRCRQPGQRWDRIAGKPYCPGCEEALAMGEGAPLIERAVPQQCSVCNHQGTLAFQTFPLDADELIVMDLCPDHLRNLLARRLGPHAFHQLQRQLHALGVTPDDVFLLHNAFYDTMGRARRPIFDVE